MAVTHEGTKRQVSRGVVGPQAVAAERPAESVSVFLAGDGRLTAPLARRRARAAG